MDAPAQGRQRAPRHLAQRQPLRRAHVPDRGRQQGPTDRRRVRRIARAQRAADRDQAAQGHVGDSSAALAQRRVRQLRADVDAAGRSVGPHPAHRRELREAGAEGRARDAGLARHQPVQVRVRRGVRLAQHRGPLSAGQLLRRPFVHRRHARGAHVRQHRRQLLRRAHREHGRPDWRMGRREHARVAVRSHAAQGDVRRQRSAHQGAPVRRMGVRGRRSVRRRLGEDGLRERRTDGRRPAAGQGQGADVHRVGGEGPDVR